MLVEGAVVVVVVDIKEAEVVAGFRIIMVAVSTDFCFGVYGVKTK